MSQPADETTLGEMLVTTGKLSREELVACLEAQRLAGGPGHKHLGEILVERGHLTIDELRTLLESATEATSPSGAHQLMHAPTAVLDAGSDSRGQAMPQRPSSLSLPDTEDISDELRQAMADPRRRIGRYVALSELGRGGMGIVYHCHDPHLHREVAIKMLLDTSLPIDPNDPAGALARFSREARAVAKLRHPGIVALHEVGEHQGQPFLVMDFVEGESFEDLLKRKKPSSRRIAEILCDVARAITHAHEAGIIHRDIKPHNIMVDLQGRPHVMDFGVARDISARQQITRTGQIMGTPAFMAPEQADANKKGQGPWTDIYALGALLYRALTGRPPFQADNQISLIKMVLTEDPIPPRRLRPRIPPDLETITLKCLEKDPDRRYPSAAAVADELERFLAGSSIQARPVGWSMRTVRWIRRNQLVSLTILAMVVVSTCAMVAVMSVSQKQRELEAALLEERSRPRAEEETREEEPITATEATPLRRQPQETAAAQRPTQPDLEPSTSSGWFNRAYARAKRGDQAGAIEDYSKALDLDPRNAQAWNNRGGQRAAMGELDGAITDFSKAIEFDQRLVQAWTNRGKVRGDKGDLDGSIADITRAIEIDPAYPIAWHYRGMTRLAKKDYDGAIADFTQAIDIKPNYQVAWYRRGRARRLKGDFHGAIADFSQAIGLDPSGPLAWNGRGLVRQAHRDLDGAIADFTRAIEIDPQYNSAWLNRGNALMTKGEFDKALANYERALEIDPNRAVSWYNRGNARKAKKDLDGAIADYNRALELNPNYAEVSCNRGHARKDKGNFDGAIADWQRFLELAPRHRVAPGIRTQLEKLLQQQARTGAGK